MRVLLAAISCEKGDLEGNLARHLAVVEEAAAAGCALAVFPEMSLTGSVDQHRHPEHAVATDDRAVAALASAATRVGVEVVVGIGERADDALLISQLHLRGGEVGGVQRKRRLGEGEEGFATSDVTEKFAIGGVPFGIVICAESHVDFTWEASVATGERLVCLCSAPGLDERCTDEATWRTGFDWWGTAGLADAQHQAARHGVWVAMATQAGSTVDEDFPGIAALIDPTGTVVDRLPDWRPGTLVVDVPLEANPLS
ncbi:MAG: nitrilase-related carbon-nitrogen hydrolase [Acidimicrobiales bacterium]